MASGPKVSVRLVKKRWITATVTQATSSTATPTSLSCVPRARMIKTALDWFKKKPPVATTKFVELSAIDVTSDPVRPELSLEWRKAFGRKIFALEQDDETLAVICLAFTNDVPQSIRELDLMCQGVGKKNIAVAYTVWSNRRGSGFRIVQKVVEYAKIQEFDRLVTLSPLTPVSSHFHIRNGARLIAINPTTQNFEYKLTD